jgi:hypothetical protein
MTTKTTSNTSSMFTSLLAVLFIGLKLTGYIAWPWLWVDDIMARVAELEAS